MHCPWYNSNMDHHMELQTIMMKDSMEELFYKNNVNIVITGHVHAYERTYPVYKNESDGKGIVYITIGDGGNLEGHSYNYYDKPVWSAFRNGTQYGHGIIKIIDENYMAWEWHRNIDGEIYNSDKVLICNSFISSSYC